MEGLKRQIKYEIEKRFASSDFITDVVIMNISTAGKSKIIIGIETLTHNLKSNVYDMEDYETDDDIIDEIILNHLEEIGSALVEHGWEKAKKEYYPW